MGGPKLEAIPKDPHGKFRVEAPTKPYWPKKNATKKVVKNAPKKVVKNAPKVNKVVKTSVKKTGVKPVPKVTPKDFKPSTEKKVSKQEKANDKSIHSGLPKSPKK